MIRLQIVLYCTARGPDGRRPTTVENGEHGHQPNIAIKERKFVAFKLGLKRS